jgi:hypothetical protein
LDRDRDGLGIDFVDEAPTVESEKSYLSADHSGVSGKWVALELENALVELATEWEGDGLELSVRRRKNENPK